MNRKPLPFAAASLLVVLLGCASTSAQKNSWAVGEWSFKQTITEPKDRPIVLTGKIVIEPGKRYCKGKIYFDAREKWEDLDEVWVTADRIEFNRPEYQTDFEGRRVGPNKIEGVWNTSSGRTLGGRWEAERN